MTFRIGLIFVRQTSAPHVEPFFNEVIIGLEDGLTRRGDSLLVRRVDDAADELAVYRQWQRDRLVDAVVVKDWISDDPRHQLLHDLGLPYATLADFSQLDGHSAVYTDNGQTMRDALTYLVGNGHRHVARVSGPAAFIHTQIRNETFLAETAAGDGTGVIAVGDYSEESGYRMTLDLLANVPAPSAIVYDNDLMAVGGLSAAKASGIMVPDRLSLLAWDDSISCQLTNPSLSALSHDVYEVGVQLSRVLNHLLNVGVPAVEAAAQPRLIRRGTTGRCLPAADQVRSGDRAGLH